MNPMLWIGGGVAVVAGVALLVVMNQETDDGTGTGDKTKPNMPAATTEGRLQVKEAEAQLTWLKQRQAYLNKKLAYYKEKKIKLPQWLTLELQEVNAELNKRAKQTTKPSIGKPITINRPVLIGKPPSGVPTTIGKFLGEFPVLYAK